MWQAFENHTLLVLDRCGRLAYQQHLQVGDVNFSTLQGAITLAHHDLPCGPCHSQFQVTNSNRPELDLVGPSLGNTQRVLQPSASQSRISSIAQGYSPSQSVTSGGSSDAPSSRKKRMSGEKESKRKRKRKNKKHRRNQKKQRNRKNRKGQKRPVVLVNDEKGLFELPCMGMSIISPLDEIGCLCRRGRREDDDEGLDGDLFVPSPDCLCTMCEPKVDAEPPVAAVEVSHSERNLEEAIAEVLSQSFAEHDAGQETIFILTDGDPSEDELSNTETVMEILDIVRNTEPYPQSAEGDLQDAVMVLLVHEDKDADNFVESHEEKSGTDDDLEPTSVFNIVWPRDKPAKNRNNNKQDRDTKYEIDEIVTMVGEDAHEDLDDDKLDKEEDFVMAGPGMNDINSILDRDEVDKIVQEEEDMAQTDLIDRDLIVMAGNEVDNESFPLGIDVVVDDNPEANGAATPSSQPLPTEVDDNRSEHVDEDIWAEETYRKYEKKKIDKFGSKKSKDSSYGKSDGMWKKPKKQQNLEYEAITRDAEEEISLKDEMVANWQEESDELVAGYPEFGTSSAEDADGLPSYGLVVREHVTVSPTLHDPDSSSDSRSSGRRLVLYQSAEDSSAPDEPRSALFHSKVMPWMNRKL